MTTPSWQVTGQYYETCNCDFVCPCVPGLYDQSNQSECIHADIDLDGDVDGTDYGHVAAALESR